MTGISRDSLLSRLLKLPNVYIYKKKSSVESSTYYGDSFEYNVNQTKKTGRYKHIAFCARQSSPAVSLFFLSPGD